MTMDMVLALIVAVVALLIAVQFANEWGKANGTCAACYLIQVALFLLVAWRLWV